MNIKYQELNDYLLKNFLEAYNQDDREHYLAGAYITAPDITRILVSKMNPNTCYTKDMKKLNLIRTIEIEYFCY